jgi:Dolichyl-phosphate-mannose-protein mannosyltransferase
MAIGVALRWIDWRAYRPALLYPDSVHYLSDAVTGELNDRRPSGYSFLLGPLVSHGNIAGIALAQHLLVLGIAILLYALMLRRGVPAWGAALALVPLLLDPLQLVLEQYVLSDVLFEALLVVACALLLWRRRPSLLEFVAAGAVLGYAAIVRGAGIGLIVPAALAAASLRLGWRRVAAIVVAFAVPLVIYMAAFQSQHGVFATNTFSSRYLYGRVTTFVHCHSGLRLPSYERPLCPKQSVSKRHSSDWYMWRKGSPQKHLKTPRGVTVIQALRDFDKRAIRAQPLAFARIAARDFLYGFHPSRTHSVPGFPPSRWLFHHYYWSLHDAPQTTSHFRQLGYGPFVAHRKYTRFLTDFQSVFHTPGPLLLAAALIAAVATAGVGRARQSGNRVASGLFLGLCLIPLMMTAALSGFSWRYQLPQLALLAPAGALGLAALLRRPRCPLPEPTTLHRLTTSVLRRSSSDTTARSAEYAVGLVAAAMAGLLFGTAAYVTHWARPATALVLALCAFLAVAVLLFSSRWRGTPAPTGMPPPDAVPRAVDVGPSDPVASDR